METTVNAGSGNNKGIGAEVRLVNVSRYYAEVAAVRLVNLTVQAGEFMSLLGPSGSGKTTTLMMIAGFVTPSAGDILIGGQSVMSLPPDRRNLGVVFQNYALFPHMSVFDNVAFPLRMRRANSATIKGRVQRALDMVQLGTLGSRRINALSGGQQQRVALARALVFEPPVMLMDEPLGALDRKLREQMQIEVKRIQRALGVTVIYVTHDQDEALALSDRIAVMSEGSIHQVGTPAEVYERPATAFVAEFIGESNVLEGVVEASSPTGATVVIPLLDVRVQTPPTTSSVGAKVRVMLRPEAFALLDEGVDVSEQTMRGVVEDTLYLGQVIRYSVRVNGVTMSVKQAHRSGDPTFRRDARVVLAWPRSATFVEAGDTGVDSAHGRIEITRTE